MKSKLLIVCGTAALGSILACGDSGDNSSGVAGDTLVKDVTTAEVEKVCRWTLAKLESLTASISTRQFCTSELAFLSDTKAECKEAVDACVKETEDEAEEVDEEDCQDTPQPNVSAGCSAVTVADYEQCVSVLSSRVKKVITSASCDEPGEPPNFEAAAEDLPSQCETILSKCPSLLPEYLQSDDDATIAEE